jgi:hypothetical protein
MKNIHVLPTEKPSRLHLWFNKLELTKEFLKKFKTMKNIHVLPTQHIYITSDEKFVRAEWITDGIEVIKATPKLVDAQGLVDRRDWRKIILTTDQDLIKDGVQAIDDKFLEWFVKNPSCEEVEVEKWTDYKLENYKDVPFFKYEIIIPKEEVLLQSSIDGEPIWGEARKQETLEEAAERYDSQYINRLRPAFIAGAKWQQEQDKKMYSEEEVEDLIYKVCGTVARLQGITVISTLDGNHIVTAYNKFKKK